MACLVLNQNRIKWYTHTMEKETKDRQVTEYAEKIMVLARDSITVQFRFFDTALLKYRLEAVSGLGGYIAENDTLKYDPAKLLKDYLDEPNIAFRLYLHILFHSVFLHRFRFDKPIEEYWNIATDIAVENVILKMDIGAASMMKDDEERSVLDKLKKWVPELTAEKLYREFAVNGISQDAHANYLRLFSMDRHPLRETYQDEPETILSEEDWKKISERVKTEIKNFSKGSGGDELILGNLEEATRTRYDYDAILRKFTIEGEEIKVNPDEFDYIYYTYGLRTYGNLPLIEPLEYAEDKKIRDFVIAIDTSGSVRGELVKKFLEKTYEILSTSASFYKNVNIHIVQCDTKIQEDIVITNLDDLTAFTDNMTVKGFGGTDFRPVFTYVDELIAAKKLEHLKGLIYLTDGYGIYPTKKPDYDVIFAFMNRDLNRLNVPAWAIQVVLEEDT